MQENKITADLESIAKSTHLKVTQQILEQRRLVRLLLDDQIKVLVGFRLLVQYGSLDGVRRLDGSLEAERRFVLRYRRRAQRQVGLAVEQKRRMMTGDHRVLVRMMLQVLALVLVVDVRLVVDLVDLQVAGVQVVAETVAVDLAGDQRAAIVGQLVADHFAAGDLGAVRCAVVIGRVEQVVVAELIERIQQHFGSLRTRTDQLGILVQTLLFLQQEILDPQLLLRPVRLLGGQVVGLSTLRALNWRKNN